MGAAGHTDRPADAQIGDFTDGLEVVVEYLITEVAAVRYPDVALAIDLQTVRKIELAQRIARLFTTGLSHEAAFFVILHNTVVAVAVRDENVTLRIPAHVCGAAELKVTHLRALIGFSMGAQQAFQWAVSYPDFASRIVATSGTAKTYGHGVVRLEGQIAALTTDPAFQNGDYSTAPKKGLAAFGMVWAGWLYSQEWWRRELWRTTAKPGTTFEEYMNSFRTRFSADANDYILQAHTWQKHDIGTTPGFGGDVEKALRSIKVPFLYMPSATDLYFPINDAQYEQAFIPHVTFLPIPSLWGHTAGAASNPADATFLNLNIGKFLAGF